MNKEDMTLGDILKNIENYYEDTEYSREVFKVEEWKEYQELKEKQKSGRRDWIIIWEIYRKSNGLPNQQFHLKNYLQFKLHDGLKESDCFFTSCYRYIRNAALIFYIREVVFNEKKEDLQQLVEEVVDYYKNGGKINTAYKIAKKKISK